VSLGLADPISWLIARRYDDLAVPKLIEEGLICIMKLYQCYLWLGELTNGVVSFRLISFCLISFRYRRQSGLGLWLMLGLGLGLGEMRVGEMRPNPNKHSLY